MVPVAAPCSGCPHPAPLNDPTILEVADFALKEYDRNYSDEDSLHVIVQLVKAYSQVLLPRNESVIKYFSSQITNTHKVECYIFLYDTKLENENELPYCCEMHYLLTTIHGNFLFLFIAC